MKAKEEGETAREGHSSSRKRSASTDDHRNSKKAKSGSKEKPKCSEVNGKYHRSSAKNLHSGSSHKPLQESKITSSEKFKSDAGNSGSEVEGVKLDSFEDLDNRVDRNNNLEQATGTQGKTDGYELAFVTGEIRSCKSRTIRSQSGSRHKDQHKATDDKESVLQRSRHKKDGKNRKSDVKSEAKVKCTDNSHTSLTALKEEDIEEQIFDPISGFTRACLPVENDLEMRKEKSNAEKKRYKDCTVNITKDKTQGQQKKRRSRSTERNEPKKNKKAKREEDEDKKKQKEKREAKKAEEEAGKWKWRL